MGALAARALLVTVTTVTLAGVAGQEDSDASCALGSEACPTSEARSTRTSAGDGRGRCDFSEVLSRLEDFPQDSAEKLLPGMHALCIWQTDAGGARGYAYLGAVASGEPLRFELPAEALKNVGSLRKALARRLGVKRKTSDWGHSNLKQDFGLFDVKGQRLGSTESVMRAREALLLEGGQWVWPPVRVGYERRVEGLALRTLSVQPIIFAVKGFLQKKHCKQLIMAAREQMGPSEVLRRKAQGYRTSSDTRIESRKLDFLPRVNQQVANLTRIPAEFHENAQVAHFASGEYYAFHADAFDPREHAETGNNFLEAIDYGHKNRHATMLWYLSRPQKGGHTWFPQARGLPEPEDRKACEGGLRVSPRVGDAVLFYNLRPDGGVDDRARHAGCPPGGDSEKWSVNKWIWNKEVPSHKM